MRIRTTTTKSWTRLCFLVVCLLLVFGSKSTSAAAAAFTTSSTFSSTSTAAVAARPPLGATYGCSLRFPVIGSQQFNLHIINEGLAHLVIKGTLDLDDQVLYRVENGRLLFELSDKTLRILKRFRTRIHYVGYDATTDTAHVEVAPPLLRRFQLRLKRGE